MRRSELPMCYTREEVMKRVRRFRFRVDIKNHTIADYLDDPVGVLIASRDEGARLFWRGIILLNIVSLAAGLFLYLNLNSLVTIILAVCSVIIVTAIVSVLMSLHRLDMGIRAMGLHSSRTLLQLEKRLEEDGAVGRSFLVDNPLN